MTLPARGLSIKTAPVGTIDDSTEKCSLTSQAHYSIITPEERYRCRKTWPLSRFSVQLGRGDARPLTHRANYKNYDVASLVDRLRQPPRQASRRISLATSQYETLFDAIQDVGRTPRSDCAHCGFPWTCSCDGQGPGCMPILMIRFEPAAK